MAAGFCGAMTGAGAARLTAGGGRGGRRRPRRLALGRAGMLLACVACVCLAACGSGHPAAAIPAWEVRSGLVRGLGEIVTDGHGFTLYIYVPDHQGPSVCAGVCAAQWPPLVLPRGVRRPVAGPGVNPALLGTIRRAGGSLQVTYNRWPLYLWQGDFVPGQATGQAEAMGLWYTLSVKRERRQAAAALTRWVICARQAPGRGQPAPGSGRVQYERSAPGATPRSPPSQNDMFCAVSAVNPSGRAPIQIGGYRTLPNQLMVTLRRRLTGCGRPKMDEQACMPP